MISLLEFLLQKHILPIYEDLSKNDLFQRSLDGHSQWEFQCDSVMSRNHLNSSVKILVIAAYSAAGLFNEGYS